jgi:hypothetical protein
MLHVTATDFVSEGNGQRPSHDFKGTRHPRNYRLFISCNAKYYDMVIMTKDDSSRYPERLKRPCASYDGHCGCLSAPDNSMHAAAVENALTRSPHH